MTARKIGWRKSAEERWWAKVDKDGPGGCWLWTAHIQNGYGTFMPARRQCVRAHRFGYELLVGPIPEGLHLDHLCRVRHCVNPAHLEPVTQAENNKRALPTHCPYGHPYDDENTYWRPAGSMPGRECRACKRRRNQAVEAKRKAGVEARRRTRVA